MKKSKNNITLNQLCSSSLSSEEFEMAMALNEIANTAVAMANLSKGKVSEDGEFAKVYATQVADRMDHILRLATEKMSSIVKA